MKQIDQAAYQAFGPCKLLMPCFRAIYIIKDISPINIKVLRI